jgi:hypothetical protein
MPYNWERQGGTLRSFREVLKRNEAHCLEAALVATVILEQHGYPPLLLDIESVDLLDHVILSFSKRDCGAQLAGRATWDCTGANPCFVTSGIWFGVTLILTWTFPEGSKGMA